MYHLQRRGEMIINERLRKKIHNFLIEANKDLDDLDDLEGFVSKYKQGQSSANQWSSVFNKATEEKPVNAAANAEVDVNYGKSRDYVKSGAFSKEFKSGLNKAIRFINKVPTDLTEEEYQQKKKKGSEYKQKSEQEIFNNRLLYFAAWLKGNDQWKELYIRSLDLNTKLSQNYEINPKFAQDKEEDTADKRKSASWTAADYGDFIIPKKDEKLVKEWKNDFKEFQKNLWEMLTTDMTTEIYNFFNTQLKIYEDKIQDDDEIYDNMDDQEKFNFKVNQANDMLASMAGINSKTGEFMAGKELPDQALTAVDQKYEDNQHNQFDVIIAKQKYESIDDFDEDDEENFRIRREIEREEYEEEQEKFFKAQGREDDWIESERYRSKIGGVKPADRLIEYQQLVNDLEKRIDSDQFIVSNLNKNAGDFEGQGEELNPADPSTDSILRDILKDDTAVQNIDRLVSLYYIYASFKIKSIALENKLAETADVKKGKGGASFRKGYFEKAKVQVEKFIDGLNKKIENQINNKIGIKYPAYVQKLTELNRVVEKMKHEFTGNLKGNFWTIEALCTATMNWKPSSKSGLERKIDLIAQQASWTQMLLRSNKLSEMRVITLQKWVETLDELYNVSKGYQESEAATIQQKVDALKKELSTEETKEVEQEIQASSVEDKKKLNAIINDLLNNNAKYNRLLELSTTIDDEMAEIQEKLDVYKGTSESEYFTTNIGSLENELNELAANFAKVEAQITKISHDITETAKQQLKKQQNESKQQEIVDNIVDNNSSVTKAIVDLEKLLVKADRWNKKSYEKVPGSAGKEFNVKQFEKFGNIRNKSFTPDYLINQAGLAKKQGDKKGNLELDPTFKTAVEKYYEYPESTAEYNLENPSARYISGTSKAGVKSLGKDVDVLYIKKLMENEDSPYKHFHTQLMGDFFDETYIDKAYKNDMRVAVIDWFKENYSNAFGNGANVQVGKKADTVQFKYNLEGDEKFVFHVVEYLFGLKDTKTMTKFGENFFEQNPERFQVSMESKYQEMVSDRTPFTPSKLGNFAEDLSVRRKFFRKLADAATFIKNPNDPLELKTGGPLAQKLLNLYNDPNIVNKFNEWINGIPVRTLKVYFEDGIQYAEFYENEGPNIIDPAQYIKARG